MKLKILFVLYFVFSTVQLFAQEKEEFESSKNYELLALPLKKGISYTQSDKKLQVNFHFRMQSRVTVAPSATYNNTQILPQVRRLRMSVDGYLMRPELTYKIQLGLAPTEIKGSAMDNTYNNSLLDAQVFYKFNKRFSIGFGQGKLPGDRQTNTSSSSLQLSDASINNEAFGLSRDIGLFFIWSATQVNDFGYKLSSAITSGEGRNNVKPQNLNFTYTGKVELFPLGDFAQNGAYFEGDLLKEKTPKILLSSAYQFNHKALRNKGHSGAVLFDPRDLHTFLADFLLKYQGFSVAAAYMQRYTAYELTFNPKNLLENDYVIAGRGWDVQTSYLLPKNYEIIGRYSWQKMQGAVHQYLPNTQQISLGLNKYFYGHNLKIQGETGWNVQKYYDGSLEKPWYVRFQIELGI